jgi:hypothetical protein
MSTKIRSSQQLYIDENLQFNSKKGVGLIAGTAAGDAVEYDQMNAAINNAVAGVGSSIHVPVADLSAAKAITAAGRADKMLMLIETIGLYHFDAESTAPSNDGTIIRPTDVASDVAAGRWIKMSSILTDHALLDNILGNGGYHLSLAERDKLTGIEAGADATDAANVGAAINSTAANAALNDADVVPVVSGGVLGKFTFTVLKSFLKTYFDTLYNKYIHPNHTGDVTSVADGAQTIAANAVTNAKLADMGTGTIKGRTTAATGDPEDLSASQVRSLLNVADGANAYSHPNHTGDVTSAGDGAQTIAAKAVTLAKMADMATDSFLGRDTAGSGAPEVLSIATVKTLLGLNANNQSSRFYRATPSGLVNGSNTQFTIAANILPGTEEVFKNGLLMNAGAGNDYTITYGATTTITFLTAPLGTSFADVILVNYSV